MFNTNKIDVTEPELRTLFFKGKVFKKDDQPYLDFYQFMEFALSKESDQHYRNFMREIKVKIFKKKQEENLKNQEEIKIKQEAQLENQKYILKYII